MLFRRYSVSTEEIQQRCIQLIAEQKQILPEAITPATTFNELNVDSLDRVTLAFDVEEIYGIAIPESSLATIHSVGDMAEGIEKAIAMKQADATHTAGEA
ncbi:MAG: acyl carrier protein [Acidobacteria bacterium]|nr:acyl carrier protein [Acidobacteriota bacterium]